MKQRHREIPKYEGLGLTTNGVSHAKQKRLDRAGRNGGNIKYLFKRNKALTMHKRKKRKTGGLIKGQK